LLPDVPTTDQEDFHEEFIWTLFSCFIHHGEEVKTVIPDDVERSPVILAEVLNQHCQTVSEAYAVSLILLYAHKLQGIDDCL
jgi:hypothetical protein